MKTFISTTALALTIGAAFSVHVQAQAPVRSDAKSTITVYPFGTSPAAALASKDLAAPSARRALEGIIATDHLNAKDQTTDPALSAQLNAAGGLSQFNAVKPIERDKQLQSKYLLLGFIESAESKVAATDKNKKPIYAASVSVTVQLIDVESGAVVDSKVIDATSSFDAGTQKQCTGNVIVKRACEAAASRATIATQGRLANGEADTPQKALANATDKIRDAVADFVNDLFTKGKIK